MRGGARRGRADEHAEGLGMRVATLKGFLEGGASPHLHGHHCRRRHDDSPSLLALFFCYRYSAFSYYSPKISSDPEGVDSFSFFYDYAFSYSLKISSK